MRTPPSRRTGVSWFTDRPVRVKVLSAVEIGRAHV